MKRIHDEKERVQEALQSLLEEIPRELQEAITQLLEWRDDDISSLALTSGNMRKAVVEILANDVARRITRMTHLVARWDPRTQHFPSAEAADLASIPYVGEHIRMPWLMDKMAKTRHLTPLPASVYDRVMQGFRVIDSETTQDWWIAVPNDYPEIARYRENASFAQLFWFLTREMGRLWTNSRKLLGLLTAQRHLLWAWRQVEPDTCLAHLLLSCRWENLLDDTTLGPWRVDPDDAVPVVYLILQDKLHMQPPLREIQVQWPIFTKWNHDPDYVLVWMARDAIPYSQFIAADELGTVAFRYFADFMIRVWFNESRPLHALATLMDTAIETRDRILQQEPRQTAYKAADPALLMLLLKLRDLYREK